VKYLPVVPAELAFADDGTPWSDRYTDLYHSAQGGLQQARHVFVGGNDLRTAWAGRERFVILETGFGIGLNFLTTWQAWRAAPRRGQRLHFVSIEKHPFRHDDLTRLHARWPELADVSAPLRDAWPMLVPGLHRLHFDAGAVTLTLVFGDACDWLPQLAVTADALFLDGFSPDRNGELWSAETLAAVTRLAAPGATLATWSVAVPVRERLADCGWQLDLSPGFGNKKFMLTGRLAGERKESPVHDRRVIVIGAGAAGSSVANRLATRGYEVTVLERESAPALGASGNKAGVFRPLPAPEDGRIARLLRNGFLYGKRHLASLPGVRCDFTGVLHVARDAKHESAQRRTIELQSPPSELLRFVERDEATQLAGWPVDMGGWWFPGGGWIEPPSLCRANLVGIDVRYRADVARMALADAIWHLFDAAGQLLAQAPIVVLANGIDTPRLVPQFARQLPVRVGRGMVSHLPEGSVPPFHIVATRNGYVTPAVDGIHCAGATLASGDTDPAPRLDDHRENLSRLEAILPGYGQGLDAMQLQGRVGFRPMSPDRLPMVGPVSASDGLWAINGFGARGLVWASLCGELLASQICGDPLPLELDLCQAVAPSRFGDRRKQPAKL
jgi:tRNA 5-methylaminomethyl-2-thiouridine biosynthesis bifunctional protein